MRSWVCGEKQPRAGNLVGRQDWSSRLCQQAWFLAILFYLFMHQPLSVPWHHITRRGWHHYGVSSNNKTANWMAENITPSDAWLWIPEISDRHVYLGEITTLPQSILRGNALLSNRSGYTGSAKTMTWFFLTLKCQLFEKARVSLFSVISF